jgi:hypothetical protein
MLISMRVVDDKLVRAANDGLILYKKNLQPEVQVRAC